MLIVQRIVVENYKDKFVNLYSRVEVIYIVRRVGDIIRPIN